MQFDRLTIEMRRLALQALCSAAGSAAPGAPAAARKWAQPASQAFAEVAWGLRLALLKSQVLVWSLQMVVLYTLIASAA